MFFIFFDMFFIYLLFINVADYIQIAVQRIFDDFHDLTIHFCYDFNDIAIYIYYDFHDLTIHFYYKYYLYFVL